MRGEFRPWPTSISELTHDVIVFGQRRVDYRREYDDQGQMIVFDDLTYEEMCSVQIVPLSPAEIRRRAEGKAK